MFHYFLFRRDDFLKHYHQRSNVESTFSMIKRKFGDSVRSKGDTAMKNEVAVQDSRRTTSAASSRRGTNSGLTPCSRRPMMRRTASGQCCGSRGCRGDCRSDSCTFIPPPAHLLALAMAKMCKARPGDAAGDELPDDLVVGRVAPGRRIARPCRRRSSACRVSAAVRFQMAATFSTRALTFESGKSAAVAESIRASRASLRPSVVMASALSSRGIDLLRPQPLVAFHQLLLEGVLLLGHRAGDDDGLAAFQAGPGQVEHLGRLHVGEGPEHLLEFGQVGEAGEAAARPKRCAVRGDFHRVDHFAEGGRPGVLYRVP